jgi:hypothetical protein
MLSRTWARLAGAFLAMCLLSLCLVKCEWRPSLAPQKTTIAWRKPEAVKPAHDTLAAARIVERVVVQKLYVPRVETVHDTVRVEVPHYYVRTKYVMVAAQADSAGLTLDSLALPNTKNIIAFNDAKGNVTLDVQNSNPYFKTADVRGFTYHVPVYPRLTWGLQAGAYLTPVGPVVGVGIGLNYSLQKRK